MSDAIIQVENLSKKYRLSHQSGGRDGFRYVALRDVLAEKAKSFLRTPLGWLRSSRSALPVAGTRSPTTPDVNRVVRPSEEDFWALKDVSFEVKRGECVGIIGRNGAGKSTLLKILSRITEPTSGRVTLDGRVSSLLEVGTGFHPELTGRENIFLNGAILGMARSEIRNKFDEIVAFAEIEKFLDTPVKRYSSGMYVRLAFAVAAHLEPEILIVDEVLAVGDAQFQKKCLGKMGEVTKGGRTVLFVSHNMSAVRSLCKRVILLRGGCLVADSNTESALDLYQSRDFKETLHRKWDPPKPHERLFKTGLYLKEATILLDHDSDQIISISTAFSLAFCVHASREAVVNLSPHYLGAGGEIIFAAPSPKLRLQEGDNWFTCRMPADLLNDRVYSVQLMIVEGSTAVQVVNEALVFEVHELRREGAWHGKWPGVVRPSLEWTFRQPSARDLVEEQHSRRS